MKKLGVPVAFFVAGVAVTGIVMASVSRKPMPGNLWCGRGFKRRQSR